jgi:hypothetical protein
MKPLPSFDEYRAPGVIRLDRQIDRAVRTESM